MKQFAEFLPVALFVGGYFASGDIYLATWLLLGGLGLQLGFERWREGAVSRRTLAIFWVAYKLVGGLGITLAYVLITVVYLARGGHLR